MKCGTKSVLFGVHQFLWHPITVALAWRRCYRQWPRVHEWVAIFCHDLGYWGCDDMDGPCGVHHPKKGARIAFHVTLFICRRLLFWRRPAAHTRAVDAAILCMTHSEKYCAELNRTIGKRFTLPGYEPGKLFLPDKVSFLYDPKWFYLLRALASGEIREYISVNSPAFIQNQRKPTMAWYHWYRDKIEERLGRWEEV